MNKIILKTLIIISIAIIVLGVLSGMSIKNELMDTESSTNDVYVDGTNVTPFVDAFTELGSGLLNVIIVTGCILITCCIWLVYGIIILIINIVNKCKKKGQ